MRNRIAATKCRARAQAAATQLEAEERAARLENRRLSMSKQELHNEVLQLKNELLRHAECDSPLHSEISCPASLAIFGRIGIRG